MGRDHPIQVTLLLYVLYRFRELRLIFFAYLSNIFFLLRPSKKLGILFSLLIIFLLDNKDLKIIGYNKSVKNLVIHQAKLAKKAALDALVCSPYEVSDVRKVFKKEIITPGIQIGKKNYDQKRSMEAKKVKSDWLVIGRAITQGNIKKNIQNLLKELD